MKTDVELLQRWEQFQDQTAFTEIVQRYGGLVTATALRRCDQRQDLADEVSQRVFAMVARKAARLVFVPSLSEWLHRTTVLECSHLARREAIHAQKLATLAHQSQDALDAALPNESEATTGLLDELDAALMRLRDRDREILMLRHVQGLSYREIATTLGKNQDAAERQCRRALNSLASRLRPRFATVTALAVGAELSHGLALTGTPVAVESLSALARKLAAASGSSGTIVSWVAKVGRRKLMLAGAAALTVIGLGIYFASQANNARQATEISGSKPDATSQKTDATASSMQTSATAETKAAPPISDDERARLLEAERELTDRGLKQLSQVHSALKGYSFIDTKFPDPIERTSNAAFRELILNRNIGQGYREEVELQLCLPGTKCVSDGNIGTEETDFAEAVGPNETNVFYVAGLNYGGVLQRSGGDDPSLPILRADYVGLSGVHFVMVVRINGDAKVYETTDGIVRDERNGVMCDIFSTAYGTKPENILPPVMNEALADKDWESLLNMILHDHAAARERCLQPLEGDQVPAWLITAAPKVFANIPLDALEPILTKTITLTNAQQRHHLLLSIGENFKSYYTADRQTWPEVDRLLRLLSKAGGLEVGSSSDIVEVRKKQESGAQMAEWLETLPPEAQTNVTLGRPVVYFFALEDTEAAADLCARLPLTKSLEGNLNIGVDLWTQKAGVQAADWAAAGEWVLKQDQSKADAAKYGLARKWFQVGEFEACIKWAESIRDQKTREQLLRQIQKEMPKAMLTKPSVP